MKSVRAQVGGAIWTEIKASVGNGRGFFICETENAYFVGWIERAIKFVG